MAIYAAEPSLILHEYRACPSSSIAKGLYGISAHDQPALLVLVLLWNDIIVLLAFFYSFLVPPVAISEVLCLSSRSFAAHRSGSDLRSSVPTKLIAGKEHRRARQLSSSGARKFAVAVPNFTLSNRRSSTEKM
ncbi:hypothetical protein EDB83DRAFT_2314433 [Lactarius deliciosus]|nr:hypothetical protein EDB83DRAFT_2314433 [Lactarius deliciosus]